jgi:hypothetical protein
MHEYKIDSAGQQMQLDKIRKEMDSLVKECRDASVSLKINFYNFFILK